MDRAKKISLLFIVAAYLSAMFYAIPILADSQTDSLATQAQLQQQLQDLQNQISGLQGQLAQTTAQKNTLANKIKALKKQQAILNLQIQATNLQVADLGNQIVSTQTAISQNTAKADNLKTQMAGVLRLINQNDEFPFLYTVVSKQKLSDVFSAYQDYAQISQGLGSIIEQLKQANDQLNLEQTQLAQAQEAAQNLLAVKVLQQSGLADSVGLQNILLQQTKGKEADYQIVISDTQRQAAAIRSRIYQLLGISSQITFGQAVQIANWASGATGIQPSFLLAVLTQESNLGQNVGTCNRPGDPPNKSYKVVMNPGRDIPPFLQTTQSLGMDPNITPVSCPQRDKAGNQLGWGGAMGPAQFIPSTWVGYKDKVAALTGNSPANPWDIRDAFAAAAVKLVAGGADGSQQGNWNAAMRYFSGSTSVKYRFYGDSVLATAAKYQNDIAALGK
jgi:membrane-bound lytic murein transglycosylase B